MVCMGSRRSYIPQKFEARWDSPPAVRAGCLRRSMSVFGEVVVKWLAYVRAGGESVFPLDGDLNLRKDSRLAWATGALGLRDGARVVWAMRAIETTTPCVNIT